MNELESKLSDQYLDGTIFLFFFFLICLHWVLAVACRVLFPDQGSNLAPCTGSGVLATGLLGKSPDGVL